jgi:hypothetical protein
MREIYPGNPFTTDVGCKRCKYFVFGSLQGSPKVRVSLNTTNRQKANQQLVRMEADSRSPSNLTVGEAVERCLPFVADLRDGKTYAPWQVWSDSTTKDARFVPMPKKTAIRIYHKAVEWNRRGKLAGRHARARCIVDGR